MSGGSSFPITYQKGRCLVKAFLTILLTLGMWGTCTYVSSQQAPLSAIQLLTAKVKTVQGVDFFVLELDNIITPDTLDYQFIFHAETGMLWFVAYRDSLDWYLWNVADTTVKKVERRKP